MKELMHVILNFLKDRFNLDEDKAEEKDITESIRKEVHFKGPNLWALIFAIMIASVGLNVNSTAVIIGAMLISPIMGPIMGIGLGVGIQDFDLMRSGFKNLLGAALVSILTSALYFYITPLHDVNSELLARTNPSLWDVLIAFFGGMAGIVAGTRKRTSNVIPGVAIATALMPPLCTAGFGLATGNWFYLLGAVYLFFINSLFICLATFLIVKRLHFKKKEFLTLQIERRVRHTIWVIVTIAILPSIYLAYRIVQRQIFESNARLFLTNEFKFNRTQVISKTYKMEGQNKSIELLLFGEEISNQTLDSLREKLPAYRLSNTKLVVHQGLNAKQEIDIEQIRASILEDVFKKEKLQDTVSDKIMKIEASIPDLGPELKSLYPEMISYSLGQSVIINLNAGGKDTIPLFTARFKRPVSDSDKIKLENWIKVRIKSDSIKIILE
jgi:uncharacterized hydrophobic protein (TIGR00271 family)